MSVKAQITHQLDATTTVTTPATTDADEIKQLSLVIKTWRELRSETNELSSQVSEKKKRMKALEEMILRIMKKNNIGALDLQNSGGRVLFRRQTAKGPLGQKDMMRLLSEYLKSEEKATEALKFIDTNRGSKVKESLLYEKE